MNHTFKRILAFALCLCCVFSVAMMPAYAASSSKYNIVQGVSTSSIRGARHEFTIRGNLLTRKKITINAELSGIGAISGQTGQEAMSYLKQNSNFAYIIYDKNGRCVSVGANLRIGDSIYLPRGLQNYKVVILSKFDRYNGRTVGQELAKNYGKYFLKY